MLRMFLPFIWFYSAFKPVFLVGFLPVFFTFDIFDEMPIWVCVLIFLDFYQHHNVLHMFDEMPMHSLFSCNFYKHYRTCRISKRFSLFLRVASSVLFVSGWFLSAFRSVFFVDFGNYSLVLHIFDECQFVYVCLFPPTGLHMFDQRCIQKINKLDKEHMRDTFQ